MKTMKCDVKRRLGWVVAAGWLLAVTLTVAGSEPYELQILDGLGGRSGKAIANNAADQVLIEAVAADGNTSVLLWSAETGMLELGTLGGQSSSAVALNDRGEVIGASYTTRNEWHAFLWSSAKGMRDLGTLGGASSQPRAINNRGEVIGQTTDAKGWWWAFHWSEAQGIKRIGDLGGGHSFGNALNDVGEVIGISYDRAGCMRAFRCAGNGRTENICPRGRWSVAYLQNAKGKIVGRYLNESDGIQIFTWTPDEGMKELDQAGAFSVIPRAICNQGQIVGAIELNPDKWRACLWTAKDKLVLLPAGEEVESDWAVGINQKGTVIGQAKLLSGEKRSFTWNAATGRHWLPRPEDASVSVATAINARGTIAGYVGSSSGSRACVWRQPVSGGREPEWLVHNR